MYLCDIASSVQEIRLFIFKILAIAQPNPSL